MRASRLPFRLRGLHLAALDCAVAVVLTIAYLGFAGGGPADGQPAFGGPVWVGWLVAAGVGAPIAVRRRWPVPVMGVVLAASVAATLLDITREPYIATALAAYLVALTEPLRRSGTAGAVALAVSAGAVIAGGAVVTPAGTVAEAVGTAALVWVVIGAAWGAGFAVRAARLRAARAERSRAERALVEERLRIARELHDIVSHSLSVIVVKAGVGEHVADTHPQEARDALRVIERTGREALTEMRRALGVLRADPGGGTVGSGDRGGGSGDRDPVGARTDDGFEAGDGGLRPAPGLDDLPALARRAEQAGIRVDLRVRVPGLLAAGTAMTVYRIVQEALTNVVRHAGAGTRCRVAVDTDSDGRVRIEVVDDGAGASAVPSAAAPGGGHGLVGMRERATMYGGSLEAGPRPQGGFAVTAVLPQRSDPASTPTSREEATA
ncbi:sensor histidine kinase [Nocardiopsis sediminis]|uniref:histidine kinase n=1 Tax=Nocardiopsis sediminis TaxID=1778267 RepID=A0ABV8FN19_9ACTN